MTQIEQILEELLNPHGFTAHHGYSNKSSHYHYYHNHDKNKTIRLADTQIKLIQWDDIIPTIETFIDLNHPNSLTLIEDWAKTP